MPDPVPTRQRLLDEGLRLFAERGFRATAVGDIEAAAGLQPRRGALYRHFPSKAALLDAAVRAHIEQAAADGARIGELDGVFGANPDPELLRPVVAGLGAWFLAEMDRLHDLTRVLEHDGQRMGDLVAAVKAEVVDLSYRTAARLVRAAAPATDDPEALVVLLLGSLVALRRTAWTFGSPPLRVDDDRALAAWTDLSVAVIGGRR